MLCPSVNVLGGQIPWAVSKATLKLLQRLPDCGAAKAEPAWFGREMLSVTKRSCSPKVLDEVQADEHWNYKALAASAILLGCVCETE